MKGRTESNTHDDDNEAPTFRWTPDNTRLMLELRFKRQDQFQQKQRPKKELWNEIATEMQRQGDYSVSGDSCDLKFRNMLQTYKKNRVKEERGQQSLIVWDFYDIFKQAMKNGYGGESNNSVDELMPSMFCESICLRDDDNQREYNMPEEERLDAQDGTQSNVPTSEERYLNNISGSNKRQRLSSAHSQSLSVLNTTEQPSYSNRQSCEIDKSNSARILFNNREVYQKDCITPTWLTLSELQEYKIFGESVGLQVAHVKDFETRALLQLKIQELLFLAKIGKLTQIS